MISLPSIRLKSTRNLPKTRKFQTLSLYYSALLLICQVFLPISSTFAANTRYSANNFFFSDYTADFYLSRDSDNTSHLRVVEKFVTEFPSHNQNHGITRIIPFTNQNGTNLTMSSNRNLDIQVKHNGKLEDPYQIESEDGYFKVYIGDPDEYVRGSHTYELEYEFENVITDFDEDGKSWQELYWDTNGNDWSQRFDNVTVNLHFADDIKSSYVDQAWCYVGSYGDSDQDRCDISTTADGLKFQTTKLRARENLTFDVEFQPDTFKAAPEHYDFRFALLALANLAGIIVITILIIQAFRRFKDKREYYSSLFVKPEYTPPSGFTVAEMAENYLKKSKLGSSKVATLMELAVQHKIELIQTESKTRLGRTKTTWKVRIKSLDLTSEQAIILKILAGSTSSLSSGQEITIKQHTATSSLIKLGQDFTTRSADSLKAKGLLVKSSSKKSKVKNPFSAANIIACVLLFGNIFLTVFFADDISSYVILVGGSELIATNIIFTLVTFIIVIVLSTKYTPFIEHTEEGLKYSKYLDGLQEYIKLAEADRIKFLQSVKGADISHQGIVKLYEKLLPYAVLFKLEKSWLAEMGKYYEYNDVSNPTWYVGLAAFNAADFASAMHSASTLVSSTTTHSTTSNSSSGFSGGGGGGFSGGGGGGGGGGGW